MSNTAVRNTIEYLRRCRAARAAGFPVSYTTDPTWLVNVAINRRAGWPDDPSLQRGSAMPVRGRDGVSRFPPKGGGDFFRHLELLAREINTPRHIVRTSALGECGPMLLRRIPHRFASHDDE